MHPLTFIDIDEDADPIAAKQAWLEKYNSINKIVDFQQKNRERENVRIGKVMQRTKYKYSK